MANSRLKEEREGMIFTNNEGCQFKVIEYAGATSVKIQFLDKNGYCMITAWSSIISGQIKNPYYPSICEIGYMGKGRYKTRDNQKDTLAFLTWKNMISRCYSTTHQYHTYKDCIVCEEWHNFQTFAQWFNDNYYSCSEERMNLDKDILIKGNKTYSPETCVFVPQHINALFIKSNASRGDYPIGIALCPVRGKIKVGCMNKILGRDVHLGYFPVSQVDDAFHVYKTYKENHIKEVAELYKDKIPAKLYQAMLNYKVEIDD